MNKIKLLIIIIALSLTNCAQPKTHIEKEIIKYYSDKLHDPGSLEIVKIKKVDTVFLIDKIKINMDGLFSRLGTYNNLVDGSPKDKSYKTTRQKLVLKIENCQSEIDSIKKGFIKNNIEHFKVYFSYRANNKFGALTLNDAVAKMMYFEHSNEKGSIYSID